MSEQYPDLPAGKIEEAADWHLRLASAENGTAAWDAFAAWLEADPANRLAYDCVEDVEALLASVPAQTAGGTDSNLIRFARPATRRPAVAPWLAGAVAIAAALILVFLPRSAGTAPQDFETGYGQTKTVTLAGGTTIALNSHSRVRVYDARKVALAYGEAMFSVVRQPGKPFTVTAGDQAIHDIGTVFDVVRDGATTRVSVREGEVGIAPVAAQSPSRQIRLKAGGQLVHDDGAAAPAVSAVDPEAVAAWQKGLLVYRDAPLPAVVSDLNRYFPARVVLADERAAHARFSGVLKIDSQDNMVRRLTEFLPVQARREPDGNIALRLSTPGR